MLALDLPKMFSSDTAFLVVEHATKLNMIRITYLGTLQKIQCGVFIDNGSRLTYYFGFT